MTPTLRALAPLALLAACAAPPTPPPTATAASSAPAGSDSAAPPPAREATGSAPRTERPRNARPDDVPRAASPKDGTSGTDRAPSPADSAPSSAAVAAGPPRLHSPALRETSGLAVSRRDGAVLWAVNDSGNAPALHAMTREGLTLGAWPVEARNRDWEDLAAFVLDGVPQLLIADTGDNLRRHEESVLHLLVEPAARGAEAAPGTPLVPWRTIRFRYEDGPHDVEAVGVDERGDNAWLLVKEPAGDGARQGGVYTVALGPDDAAEFPRVARLTSTLAAPPRGLATRLAIAVAGIDLEQATAFDFSPDGRHACLLTYRRVRCFARADGEDWRETLARPAARILAAHGLEQAEALALSADGRILFTSEGIGAPIRNAPLR